MKPTHNSSSQPPDPVTDGIELAINTASIQNEETAVKPPPSRPKLFHKKSLLSGHWRRTLQEDSQTNAPNNLVFCVQGASMLPNSTEPIERTVSEIQLSAPIVKNKKLPFHISGRAYTMPVRSSDLNFDFNVSGHNIQQPEHEPLPPTMYHSPILSPSPVEPLPLVKSPPLIHSSSPVILSPSESLPLIEYFPPNESPSPIESSPLVHSFSPVLSPPPSPSSLNAPPKAAHLTPRLKPLLTESSFLKQQPPKQSLMYTKHLLNIHQQTSISHEYVPFIGQAATVRTKVSSRITRRASKSTLNLHPRKPGHSFLLPPLQAPKSKALPAIVGKTRKMKSLQSMLSECLKQLVLHNVPEEFYLQSKSVLSGYLQSLHHLLVNTLLSGQFRSQI